MSQKGFSLIEIITALVVITILAFGLSATTSYSKQIDLRNREKIQAVAVLEKEMLLIRQRGAQSLIPGTATRQITKEIEGVEGTLTTEISADAVHVHDKFVRLHLSWNGGTRSEALGTFLFQE